MKSKKPAIVYLAAVAITAASYGCGKTTAQASEDVEMAPVQVITLQKGSMSSDLKIPGELVAYQNVDLYAKVSSFVKKLYVDVGSVVKEGALLATLEAPEYESQLSGAESRLRAQEAQYISSKANYDRLLETSKTPGTVSPNDLDQALAKQQSDAAMLESAKATFREVGDTKGYLEIRAPFSGVINARNVSNGAFVGPSGKGSELPLFSLVDQQRLRLVVSIPEAYTHYVNYNSNASFSIRSVPGQNFEAKVNRMAGALDHRLRAQRVELDVFNKEKKLLPGMIAEVTIPLNTSDSSYSVPVEAVLNSTLGLFLIKIQDGKAVWVPVITGRNDAVNVEVIGDINTGDQIVRYANEELRNNAAVSNIQTSGTE